MYCPKCAAENPEEALFCRQCGTQIPKLADPEPAKAAGWSLGARVALYLGTFVIPLIGIVVGAWSLRAPDKKAQAKNLLIFGIVMFVLNLLVMMGGGY